METLLLRDPAYVEERHHTIEAERQRRQEQRAPRHQAPRTGDPDKDGFLGENVGEPDVLERIFALDDVWSPSPMEKEAIVAEEILRELTVQIHYTLERQGETELLVATAQPASPSKESAKKSTPIATDAPAPVHLQELPASSQFGLQLFFRVCVSLRKPMARANARLLAKVAAKIPSMLATLPPMPLAPGVVDIPPSAGTGEHVGETRSVFEELLIMLRPLMETKPNSSSLSQAERANVLMAYVAVSVKWARLRDLVEVLYLLITNSDLLTPRHTEQFTHILSELQQADAVVPVRPLLPEESSATGYLVSFGKGDHGKLGHGQCTHSSCSDSNCTENKTVPTVIASTKEIQFVKVDSLSTHSVAITTTGDIMAWGNGDKYRLGHGTTTKEYAPRVIDSLSLKGKVADVACGLGHTLALMANGDLYAWGNGSNGRLGLGDTNDRSNPTKLVVTTLDGPTRTAAAAPSPSPATVFRHVICGASHSLAVTSDGRVFAWGKNNQGQCGHGHTNDQLTAIEIRHFRDELNERVVCAAGGWEHTLFCSTSGRVYSCGCGYKDSRRTGIPPVLGHGDCEKRLKPTVIQAFLDANEEMARVSCGWDHSLAVSSQGALYTWGSGTNGKLGHGDEENCETPTLVRSLVGKVVKDAKAGCEHTVVLTEIHELWTFGQGDSGRLGLGDTTTRKVPTLVDFFTHSGLQPVAIAVGDKYNLILADDLSSHQGISKSPAKSLPLSPAHALEWRSDHSSNSRSRRGPGQHKATEPFPLRPLDRLLGTRGDCSATVAEGGEGISSSVVCPQDQDQLLKAIAVNLARLSTCYMSSLWPRGDMSPALLPYAIDTAPTMLERILKVLSACQDSLSQPSSAASSSERMLEIIVVCLRILTVNLSQWGPHHETDSCVLEQAREVVDELAEKGATLPQLVFDDSDRAMELQSLIQDEAAQVLQVGFTLFYPSTPARTRLLWDQFGVCDAPFSHQQSPRDMVFASKLCEDFIAHDIVIQEFVRSATHECYSSDKADATNNAASKSVQHLMMALLRSCAHEAVQRLEGPASGRSEAVSAQLQVLTVLQGHWFAIAVCSVSVSDLSSSCSRICDCCMSELSRYLCCLFDEAASMLNEIRLMVCRSQDTSVERLSLSFLDSIVLQAAQSANAFLSTLMSKFSTEKCHRGQRIAVSMAKSLLPGSRRMLELLEEISWSVHTTANTLPTKPNENWIDKLAASCALLCGQISSCFIGSVCTDTNNQPSENGSEHPAAFYLRDALRLIAELLDQLHSASTKSVLLLKLMQSIKQHYTNGGLVALTEKFDLTQAIADLCGHLTAAAATEDFSTRARVAALVIWLWVLQGDLIVPERLGQLICESGIVTLAGEILLLETSLASGDEMPGRGVYQLSRSYQRAQPSLRLRPVEEIIGALPPSQVLYRTAHEVLSAATKHLCSTFATPPGFLHPLLVPMQTNITQPTTATALVLKPSSSPRRHPMALPTVETIKTAFDVMGLLQGCLEAHERRCEAISPFGPSPAVDKVSPAHSQSSTGFLLGSPLSISTSRSHIVKPLRLPRLESPSAVSAGGPVKAISLWFFADNTPPPSPPATSPVVVLAAIGETTDRLHEGGPATGSSTTLELSTSDELRAIVFVFFINGKLRLGCTFSDATDGGVSACSANPVHPVWATWIVDAPLETGRWVHVSVSSSIEEPQTEIYVNGERQSHEQPGTKGSGLHDMKEGFGKVTPRVQLVTGGTLDEALKEAIGLSAILDGKVSSRQSTPRHAPSSSAGVDMLIDDVWVYRDPIEDPLAQRLFRQGQTLAQIKRDHDNDRKTLAVLRLLRQTLALLPLRDVSMDLCLSAADQESGTLAVRLQENLFRLVRTSRSVSSIQIALHAVETLQHIVPVASRPTNVVVETLLACTSSPDSTAEDLRDQVAALYAYSARAGVQSAAVAASQVAVQSLLRQYGILTARSEDAITTLARCRHVLTGSLVDLAQNLSGMPAWQPHCTLLLEKAATQMTEATEKDPTGASTWGHAKPLAAVTMVAGYCEGVMNGKVVALGSVKTAKAATQELQAPWATATRSCALLLTSESFHRMAWRVGCDFHSGHWNLRGRHEGLNISEGLLRAHDMVVLDRIRLQSQLLRSLVGLSRSCSSSWREQIFADPETLALLLRAAEARLVDVVHTRLGADRKAARTLASVRLLNAMMTPARRRYRRLLVEEELEVFAAELLAKLDLQYDSMNPVVLADSIIRPPCWRDPRTTRSPLEPLSGDVEICGLTLRALEHFPTVRLGGVAITASSGLWYYEVQLLTDGLMQIGYVDPDFVADAVQGQGVGDHTNSWAFDGYRRKKWNVSSSTYGESWRAGDVVGVLLDTDRLELSYFLNGKFLGVAFSNLPLSLTSLLFPAVSLNADQRVRFDFGTQSSSADSIVNAQDDAVTSLRLPSLSSPLDAQRLRPVAAAIEETAATGEDDDSDDTLNMESDKESDTGRGHEEVGVDGDGVYSPLETPTTPPSDGGFRIYHPAKADGGEVFQLPGALNDDVSDLPPGLRSLISNIQPSLVLLDQESKRGDLDGSGDHDGSAIRAESTRQAELMHGLVNLGFPRAWAERCAQETSFTLSDAGAITWILEQMEGEAASSMDAIQRDYDSAREGVSDELTSSDAHAAFHPRRARDDLSLSVKSRTIGPDGRRSWQLALSPSRDGRPHSEQLTRSCMSLSSPQKLAEPTQVARKAPVSLDVNPFLKSEMDSEGEDEDDPADSTERGPHTWNATATHGFYKTMTSGSLRQQFARLELITNDDPSRSKDGTLRRAPAGEDPRKEDPLPACIVTHSILSLAYVRLLVESLLFSRETDVASGYPVAAQWANAGLFDFMRKQLQLHPKEITVSRSRACDERRLQSTFTRMLQFEIENGSHVARSSTPLLRSVVLEISARIADALRDCRRANTLASPSEKTAVTFAMHARWTLWLVSSLHEALRDAMPSSDAEYPPAFEMLLAQAFTTDLIQLITSATSSTTMAWRNAAFSIVEHVLSMEVLTRRSTQRTTEAPTLIPIQFLVELLARLVRKDASRRIAFGDPIATLWHTVLAHAPPAPQAFLPIPSDPPQNEITLRVEQVASTYITISWECLEFTTQHSQENAMGESSLAIEDNSVLSLRVVPVGGEISPSAFSLARGVPHFLPPKGSLGLRQLAPDTVYSICVTKSSSPWTAEAETHGTGKAEGERLPTTVTRAVHVQTPLDPIFELDGDAAGKNLVLSNRNRTVQNQVNKKWHTVRATVGFDEGVHHWHVRIDVCVSKNIFIGVSTSDASLENYVGSDAFGYGFLANKAVWHNKTKLHAYGEIFKQGDLLQVSLDCNARTLSFSRNGEWLGVAANNLHVAASSGGGIDPPTTGSVGCKWYPAFSLYNKDDQLTLIAPQSSAGMGLNQPKSQHASMRILIDSARILLGHADHARRPRAEGQQDREPSTSSLYETACSKWLKWKRGDVCWREVGIGEVIEIDSTRDAAAKTFGLAPGDSIFTSRGHCVVLGVHNHELWYEVVDALARVVGGKTSLLGSWTLNLCRDMVRTPDEYPVHRTTRNSRAFESIESSCSLEAFTLDRCTSQSPPDEAELHENHSSVEATGTTDPLDVLLVSLIDAIVAHRGLRSAYQLGYADLSSALILHDVVDTLRLATAPDDPLLRQDALLMRLLILLHLNQHVYRVVRLFLLQSPTSQWEHSLGTAASDSQNGSESSDPDKDRRDRLKRLAANVGFPRHSLSHSSPEAEGTRVINMRSRDFLTWLRMHLFETQREQLIAEALRRTATPTLVGTISDPKSSDLGASGDDALPGEPKEMLRLKIRLPVDGPAVPFWQQQRQSKTVPSWMLPAKETRLATLFVQVSTQLYRVDPAECRRQFTRTADPLPIYHTFQLGFLDPSSSAVPYNDDPTSDAVVLAEHASQYLTFWDDLFTELQSPRFPLFIPTNDSGPTELDINPYLLLPEYAVRCGIDTDEALSWYFQLGQLLGMVWRAHVIVPLQFISFAFWTELLDEEEENEEEDHRDGTDRECGARLLAIRSVREGLCCVVPYECLQLSTPQSLRSRLSDTDTFQIDRLQHHATYDREAAHHEAFWSTLRGFSTLERQACMRFLSGKMPWSSPSQWSRPSPGDDPMEQWKRQVHAVAGAAPIAGSLLFRLELVEALADAQDHPDACFPVVHVVDAQCTRLHLPVYSSASVLRQKLLVAMSTSPVL